MTETVECVTEKVSRWREKCRQCRLGWKNTGKRNRKKEVSSENNKKKNVVFN